MTSVLDVDISNIKFQCSGCGVEQSVNPGGLALYSCCKCGRLMLLKCGKPSCEKMCVLVCYKCYNSKA